eukprot:6183372-Pleurochrysis_carterae.AAC.1
MNGGRGEQRMGWQGAEGVVGEKRKRGGRGQGVRLDEGHGEWEWDRCEGYETELLAKTGALRAHFVSRRAASRIVAHSHAHAHAHAHAPAPRSRNLCRCMPLCSHASLPILASH